MKAALLHLVLDKAATLFAHVTKHLAEHKLQRVVADTTATGTGGVFHRLIAVIADVERRAIEMAGVFGGIAIEAAQPCHVILRTEHTGDDETVEGYTFYI